DDALKIVMRGARGAGVNAARCPWPARPGPGRGWAPAAARSALRSGPSCSARSNGGSSRPPDCPWSAGSPWRPRWQSGELKPFGGSGSDTWNKLVANQVAKCLSTIGFTEEQRNSQFKATISSLIGISPQDEIEGMIAAQMIAAHAAAMECYRRAV